MFCDDPSPFDQMAQASIQGRRPRGSPDILLLIGSSQFLCPQARCPRPCTKLWRLGCEI